MSTEDNLTDQTNPSHYRPSDKPECIDAMVDHFRAWLHSGAGIRMLGSLGFHHHELPHLISTYASLMMVGFCVGNAFKYRYRKGAKPGQGVALEEGKAAWYDAMAEHQASPFSAPDPRTYRAQSADD